MKDYADILEDYLIAEEGFFSNFMLEENMERLKNGVVFAITTHENQPYGGIDTYSLQRRSGRNEVIDVFMDNFMENGWRTRNNTTTDLALKNILDSSNIRIGGASEDSFYNLINKCSEYSESTNKLIVIHTSNYQLYTSKVIRKFPIVLASLAVLVAIILFVNKTDNRLATQIIEKYKNFKILSKHVPNRIRVKNLNIELYHISKDGKLKELTPDIPSNPMFDENIGIKRISTAPTVQKCFIALGVEAIREAVRYREKYFVYKIEYDSTDEIAKPDAKLVPDCNQTDEYWILNKVPVKLIGYIIPLYEGYEYNDYDFNGMPPGIKWKWNE